MISHRGGHYADFTPPRVNPSAAEAELEAEGLVELTGGRRRRGKRRRVSELEGGEQRLGKEGSKR